MRKLLWIGDAGCESGFAKCTHKTLDGLDHRLNGSWECHVLGLNYRGDPDVRTKYPYDIYPCWPGKDMFGVGRTKELIDKIKPDLVVIQNDPWNIPAYMMAIGQAKHTPQVAAVLAVDGLNCRGRLLNKLDHVIFWTKFAEQEAISGGMDRPSSVIPLGVDLDVYTPGDKREARKMIGLPQAVVDGFIVLNVNRNQPRKRLDLTIRYFAKWVERYKRDDAFLYLHVAPTGDQGYYCDQLGEYYGINTPKNRKLVLAEPEMYHGTPEAHVVRTLRAADLQFSTTQGEGWGLTTMEGMACGIPQLVPRWSALEEWTAGGAKLVDCTSTVTTPMANAVGGIMDEEDAIDALEALYTKPVLREGYIARGHEVVAQPQYRWPAIATEFARVLDEVSARRQVFRNA